MYLEALPAAFAIFSLFFFFWKVNLFPMFVVMKAKINFVVVDFSV